MPITAFLGLPRVSVGVLGRLAHSTFPPRTNPIASNATRSLCSLRPLVWTDARARLRIGGNDSGALLRRTEGRFVRTRTLSTSTSRLSSPPSPTPAPPEQNAPQKSGKDAGEETELHESPYTLPNALTLVRIAACPFLAWAIVKGNFEIATGILVASGLTDWLDGYLARKWNQKTVLGSIIDPMADKTLVTTLVVCLTYKGLLPLPLAVLIFGRDFALSMWAFYLRFQSLPPPRTLKRYFDPTMPSAEVKPTQISKINTALQLLLMGLTTISPLLAAASYPIDGPLQGLQWIVAGTTIWSGFSYVGAGGYKFLKPPGLTRKP